jgi:hypothetical protein
MAATGFTPIQLYYSATAAQQPLAANLASGELAVNITDGKLYYKDNTGSVKVLANASSATGNLPGGGTGTVVYQSAAGVTAYLTLGTNGYLLTAGASAPQYSDPTTFTVGIATKATNISGGSAGQVVYQTATNVTGFSPTPSTAGTVLGWTGSALSWVSAPAATSATNLSGGGAYTVVYQSSAGTTAYLTNGTTGQVLTANTGGAPTWGSIPSSVTSFQTSLSGLTPSTSTTGAVTLAGTLGTSSGGTNSTATPTAGTIAYGTGSAYAFTTASTIGYLLTSGGSGTPTWTNPTTFGTANGKLYFFGQF